MCVGPRHTVKLADLVHFLTGSASGKTENQPSSGCAFLLSLWWPRNKRFQGKEDLEAQFTLFSPWVLGSMPVGSMLLRQDHVGETFCGRQGVREGILAFCACLPFTFISPRFPAHRTGLLTFSLSLSSLETPLETYQGASPPFPRWSLFGATRKSFSQSRASRQKPHSLGGFEESYSRKEKGGAILISGSVIRELISMLKYL